MAVNGGGAVTLQFQRSPLKAATRTTYLPWNGIVVINPVVMTSGSMAVSGADDSGEVQLMEDEEDSPSKVKSEKRASYSFYFHSEVVRKLAECDLCGKVGVRKCKAGKFLLLGKSWARPANDFLFLQIVRQEFWFLCLKNFSLFLPHLESGMSC